MLDYSQVILPLLLGLARTFLSIRRTLSQGRVARYNSSKVVGSFQVGFSCHVKREGQGENRGRGNFGENLALMFDNLGQENGGEERKTNGRDKTGSSTRLYFMERGEAKIKPSFCSMPVLGQVM